MSYRYQRLVNIHFFSGAASVIGAFAGSGFLPSATSLATTASVALFAYASATLAGGIFEPAASLGAGAPLTVCLVGYVHISLAPPNGFTEWVYGTASPPSIDDLKTDSPMWLFLTDGISFILLLWRVFG